MGDLVFKSEYFEKSRKLADFVRDTWDPKMKWMWGEALLGYAMSELDQLTGRDDYTDFLTAFCDYYVANPPKTDQSDTTAPALITYAMQKKTGKDEYAALTKQAIDYIQNEPRLIGDALNHLGNSSKSHIYPKSIWVDSLMMFAMFTSLYAREQSDEKLLDFAARQPEQYAGYMMDPGDHLWYHSYWVKQKTHYPKKKLYWGRGNGWVICSFPMILDQLGEHKDTGKIKQILADTSKALLNCQREDGTFETILNKMGKTYRELSATALIAAGWMHGVRKGYLDRRYLEPALKAYEAVSEAVVENEQGIYLPEISGPTIPLPLFPYLGYKLVPCRENWSYGIAAYLFASIQYRRLFEEIL